MSQGQDLAQEHMASKWQSREKQMLRALTMFTASPECNPSPIIFPALRVKFGKDLTHQCIYGHSKR